MDEHDIGQKRAVATGKQTPLRPTAVPNVDPADPPEEFADALEAEDFVVVGKASIEKLDSGGENSDTREVLDLSPDVVERALDRFFNSEKAPGIISIGHDDIPVGRPLREYTFEEPTSIDIDGETYEFDEGDTVTTHVEDADGDDRPELWFVGDIANDTDVARKARLGILLEELDGYSVTFGRKAVEPEAGGQRVTDWDLFAVTIAPSEFIANEGAEFDLAAFKAEMNRYAPTATADDATLALTNVAEELARGIQSTMSADSDTDIDEDTLLERLGQKLTGADEEGDEQDGSADDAGQKSDEEDAGQKQPEEDDGGNAVEDLVRALADELGEDPDDLMAAIQAAGQNADDEPDPDDDEDERDDEGDIEQDADESADANVSIDFGAKLDEHGVVTEDDLDSFRESIVEDVGEKLAETNREAVEDIAQKMDTGQTPGPAGGSFQDEKDIRAAIEEASEGEGW